MEDNNVTKVTIPATESGAPEEEIHKVDLSNPPADPSQTDLEDSIKEVEKENDDTVEESDGAEEGTPPLDTAETALEEVPEGGEDTPPADIVPSASPETDAEDPLPEGIQKLMTFMEETGGDMEDYVKLNQDVASIDDQDALLEYYKATKPHLSTEEISFLMEDEFSYDEDLDSERDVRKKKLARKEQVANAKAYLDGQKSKYYEEIKAGSKLTKEQAEAVDFFSRYNKSQEDTQNTNQRLRSIFDKKTAEVFTDEFKGFEYNVGDKKFRLNVKDANQVKNAQSDISNFAKRFLAEDSSMKDARGYHKGLFTAMNPDTVAQHFYEQGKADALKEDAARSKNIDTNPRGTHGEITAGGLKVRVLGDDSKAFKFKIKNKK